MINAVIVDFDDTLCLTEEACFDMENAILVMLGRPPMTRELHKATWGKPLAEAIALRSPGVDVHAFMELMNTVHAEWIKEGRVDLVPEANLAALDELIRDGFDVYILTSRTHAEVAHFMHEGHVLSSRIKAFYYRDTMQFHKPDPRAFNEVVANHSLKPETCVYVGDSVTDAAAAKGANMHFIASLEAGLRTKQDFEAYDVDAFIKRFTDLPAAVRLLADA